MEYRRYGETYYIRLDRGDEIPRCILDVCSREDIRSAVFTGIGGCSSVELQTFDPELKAFDTEKIEGMLEMASLTGNVITDDKGMLSHHTHAVFSLRTGNGQKVCAGHLKTTTVLYTAEIELRPVKGGVIGKKHDPETGTEFWDFY